MAYPLQWGFFLKNILCFSMGHCLLPWLWHLRPFSQLQHKLTLEVSPQALWQFSFPPRKNMEGTPTAGIWIYLDSPIWRSLPNAPDSGAFWLDRKQGSSANNPTFSYARILTLIQDMGGELFAIILLIFVNFCHDQRQILSPFDTPPPHCFIIDFLVLVPPTFPIPEYIPILCLNCPFPFFLVLRHSVISSMHQVVFIFWMGRIMGIPDVLWVFPCIISLNLCTHQQCYWENMLGKSKSLGFDNIPDLSDFRAHPSSQRGWEWVNSLNNGTSTCYSLEFLFADRPAQLFSKSKQKRNKHNWVSTTVVVKMPNHSLLWG